MRYLGRKAELTTMLRSIGDLPPDQRGAVGKGGNEVKQALEALLDERTARARGRRAGRAAAHRLDRRDAARATRRARDGHLHLITETRREIEDVFLGLGFSVAEGPEVEFDYYNFTALNHPPNHPARMLADTFYFSEDVLLRTHTSPMQVRAMELQEPPIYIVVPGKTYRRDSDATHTPMFHQVEGLAIDEDITARRPPGRAAGVRARDLRRRAPDPAAPALLPVHRAQRGGRHLLLPLRAARAGCPTARAARCARARAGSRSSGSGMVDPNVLGFVADNGYDPEKVQGFAFGMGIERIAMLRHGVPDLRLFFENDVRFLEQFGRMRVPLDCMGLRHHADPADPGLRPGQTEAMRRGSRHGCAATATRHREEIAERLTSPAPSWSGSSGSACPPTTASWWARC